MGRFDVFICMKPLEITVSEITLLLRGCVFLEQYVFHYCVTSNSSLIVYLRQFFILLPHTGVPIRPKTCQF